MYYLEGSQYCRLYDNACTYKGEKITIEIYLPKARMVIKGTAHLCNLNKLEEIAKEDLLL